MDKQLDRDFLCLCNRFKEKVDAKKECDQNDLNYLNGLIETLSCSASDLSYKFIKYVLNETLKLIVQKSNGSLVHFNNGFKSDEKSVSSENNLRKVDFYVQFLKYSIKSHQSSLNLVENVLNENRCLIELYLKNRNAIKENEFKLNLISLNKHLLKVISKHYKSKLPVDQLQKHYVDLFQLLSKLNPFDFTEIVQLEKRLPYVYLSAKYVAFCRYFLSQLKDNNFETGSSEFIEQRELFFSYLIYQISDTNLMVSLKQMNTSKKSSITIGSNYLYSSLIALTIQLVFTQKNEQNFMEFYGFLKNIFKSELTNDLDLIYTQQDDDFMVDFNLNYLEIQINYEKQELSTRNDDMSSYLFEFNLNAHVLFFKLLKSISFDYEIILDWLLSNETSFLTYLVRYLKYLNNELTQFGLVNMKRLLSKIQVEETSIKTSSRISIKQAKKLFQQMACSQSEQLFEFFNELFLKMKTMKHLFPYNCEPLIKLLKKIVEFEEIEQK